MNHVPGIRNYEPGQVIMVTRLTIAWPMIERINDVIVFKGVGFYFVGLDKEQSSTRGIIIASLHTRTLTWSDPLHSTHNPGWALLISSNDQLGWTYDALSSRQFKSESIVCW